MSIFGGDERESGDLLELILLCLGVLVLAAGALEVFFSIAENAQISSKEGAAALDGISAKKHSVVSGLSMMAGSVVFFWMKRVLDLLGK